MYNWHQTPGTAYLTSGIGYGRTKLSAFDAAELDANILSTNAVKVSSFIPPYWRITHDKEALKKFTDNGVFLPMAYAYSVSNHSGIAASLVIGVNKDPQKASIIMEHTGTNLTREESRIESETSLQDAFKARNWEIERLEQIAVEADPSDGLYVCVLVAAVFLTDGAKSML
ncbi:MAG: pyruvoyl-dependent arginine decarboxylase [Gammaproteobacteria bacterium]